ncbi:ketopantoate reductase family protein [Telmatospirillum siberiense]|uniref:2-dehydropantoate 2-reductase n=1 Tax=Telmatospirillum siberiense TaxID=382514 RepID=A0A2N3PP90_9PROT|nr:ketopantoate reductase family protein [Telmatospirillum siberiense]PKU22225.1 2-dehydropantoate 2-reductase [Telmatospirillum siberiense]
MKICFVGAGALGCAIGGTLAKAGSQVTLVDLNRAHVEAINQRGLIMREDGVDRPVKVTAATDYSGVGIVDLVIVLVKSNFTKAAIEAAKSIVGPETVVMSIQNGLGHEDVLAEVVGREHLLAGKTYVGGVLLAPGHGIAGVAGKLTYIGELDGSMSARAARVAEEFNRAGLNTVVSPNIVGTIWDKLLINVATGAVSAVTGLVYGGLYEVPEVEATALGAVAEAMAVAKARGVALSIREPRDAWLMASEGLPFEFKTSMLQSLERGQATEVDFINGSVVRAGKACAIPTPVNETLVACVKGIEHRLAHFGPAPTAIPAAR